MKYPVNEIFYSLQGEGYYAGRAALFVRFSGCNLRCPFCDTLHEDHKMMTGQEIVDAAARLVRDLELVVFTGGEPTLFLRNELLILFRYQFGNVDFAIETNGTHRLPVSGCFVTLSPKDQFVGGAEIELQKCSEIKVVFDGKCDPAKYENFPAKHYYLQPCDTGDKAKNAIIVEQCVEYIKEHPSWRLSLQTQKIIGVR